MNKKPYIIQVLSVAVITALLLSITLFYTRKLCQAIFYESEVAETVLVELIPAPPPTEAATITASMRDDALYERLGIFQDTFGRDYHSNLITLYANVFFWNHDRGKNRCDATYYDPDLGQFVLARIHRENSDGRPAWRKEILAYAGPLRVSPTPANNLGQFRKPLFPQDDMSPDDFIIYDQGHRRFFRIDLFAAEVTKGPQISKDDEFRPIQLGTELTKNADSLRFQWNYPVDKKTGQSIPTGTAWHHPANVLLVLDTSGQIYRLDAETLHWTGPVGYLILPGTSPKATPETFFAYWVRPFVQQDRHGLAIATIPPDLMSCAVTMFDEQGRLTHRVNRHIQFDRLEGGICYLAVKYLLENLQPPLFGLLAFGLANDFDGIAAQQSLFLLPDSFVAFIGREMAGEHFMERWLVALLILLPSLLLAFFLAWRVVRDAKVVGLSRNQRRCWFWSTVLFALPAYITYRVTRPSIVLVTCANCGQLRRPDESSCHRCRAPWEIPDLIAPDWRVLDTAIPPIPEPTP